MTTTYDAPGTAFYEAITALAEANLAEAKAKAAERERQIPLIAAILQSTSFVKVHFDHTPEKAARALYDKGLRISS